MDKNRIEKDYYVEPRKYGTKGFSYLTLELRRKLELLLKQRKPIKQIANALGISRGCIYHERMRMGSVDTPYNAEKAHQNYLDRVLVSRNRNREHLPRSHTQGISKIYRLLKECLSETLPHRTNDNIKNCMLLLEKMGADPDKMKRPITEEERIRIIELWKQGLCYSEIESQTSRSRSSVHNVIVNLKEELSKDKENILYERLSTKWLNNNDSETDQV